MKSKLVVLPCPRDDSLGFRTEGSKRKDELGLFIQKPKVVIIKIALCLLAPVLMADEQSPS